MYGKDILDFFRGFFFRQDYYLTHEKGKMDLLLLAPHGGSIQPLGIPRRKKGNRSRDSYTRRLTLDIIERMNGNPYYVIADIHRNRVDLNRNIEECSDGNKRARDIWVRWNSLVDGYRDSIVKTFGKGLLIDIHSHDLSDEFQVAYGMEIEEHLNLLHNRNYKTKTTISAFEENDNLWDMIFGENSIASLIEKSGFKTFKPSPGKTFLSGGYNIRSNDSENIGSIQIEVPIKVVRKDFERVSLTLYKAILKFQNTFMN